MYGHTFNRPDTPVFDLRDYSTGLKYQIAAIDGVCFVENLRPNDVVPILDYNDPLQFFQATNADYQYVGMVKICFLF